MKQKIFASLILMSSIIWISATNATQDNNLDTSINEIPASVSVESTHKTTPLLEIDTIPKKTSRPKSTIVELKDGKISRLEIDGVEVPEDEFEVHSYLLDDLNPTYPIAIDTGFFRGFRGYTYGMDSLESIIHSRKLMSDLQMRNDSLWPMMHENFNDVQDFDMQWGFTYDNEDEVQYERPYFYKSDPSDNTFKFYNEFHDSLKFDPDSLKGQLDDFKYFFNEKRHDFKLMFDSLDFPQMKNDVFHIIDSMDVKNWGNDFKFYIDSFTFPELDQHFDQFYSNNLERSFLNELKKDGLFDEKGNDIVLSDKKLEINGELQSLEMHERYKSIYERKMGIELLEGSNLHIKIDKNNNSSNLRKL